LNTPWIGVCYVYVVYCWSRHGGVGDYGAFLALTVLLALINNSAWGLLAVPLVLTTRRVNVALPRCKRFFYTYYAAHLATLAAFRVIHL